MTEIERTLTEAGLPQASVWMVVHTLEKLTPDRRLQLAKNLKEQK